MADPIVRDLAEAIVDGEAIDWPAIEARLGSSADQSVAEGLKTLSQIVSHQQPARRPHASKPLPLLLRSARIIAIASTVVGLVGALIAMEQIQVPRLSVMTAVLATFAVMALLLDIGATDRGARALAACYWTVAASFAAGGVRWIALTWPGIRIIAPLAALHAECFFSACLWQFARDFPIITRFGRLDRVCLLALRVTLALGATLFVANLVPLFLPGSSLDMFAAPYQRMTRGSRFWSIVFGSAIPALAVIAWRGRAAIGHEAARVRIFLYGVAVSVAPIVVEVFVEGLAPSFRAAAITPEWRSIGAWLVYPPMFVLPAVTAYAVAVDNVLEFRVVMQRGLRYLLARWLVMWGAAAPPGLLLLYLYRQSARPLAEVLLDSSARMLLMFTLAGIVVLAGRQYLVRALDRWVLPGVDDPPTVLAHMTERMKQTRTPLEVATEFAQAAERALQASTHAYLMRNGDLAPARAGSGPLPSHSLVPVLLEGSREPCVVSARRGHSYYALVTEQDRAWIDAHEIAVLVPIVSGRRAGGLMGMVALQHRRNALTFSQDDLRFLRAGAGAASLACDVIFNEGQPNVVITPPEEVGLQCVNCGLVKEWDALGRPCVCGKERWEPAVVPVDLLGRFKVSHRLGAGGMGIVYRATELSLGREVAIKTLTRLSPGAASRLRLEARAMASLTHPHIAVLYGVDVWRGTPLLAIEYLGGGTLAARLRQRPLALGDALRVVLQLASALEHVHRAGQCHGDIKPSNIGFTNDDMPKFLDFGLSHAILDENADTPTAERERRPVAGTPAYMSPEVRDGEPARPASDIWALCLVLYECITGSNPFLQARSSSEVARNVPNALTHLTISKLPQLHRFFEQIFTTASSRFPQSAADLRRALTAIDIEAVIPTTTNLPRGGKE